MTDKIKKLKSLYERDFYKWIMENVKFLKNREFDKVDWENVIEELESIGRRELRNAVEFMATILEHLYKYENFKEDESIKDAWIDNINDARMELEYLFNDSPSLREKAQEKIDLAWKSAVKRLISWFKYPENKYLADKYFGKKPTEENFPKKCPYTFQQILEYEPWVV
jgi:hypothetical protein